MIHLTSDLEYFKFVHNIAPNFQFIHNIDVPSKPFQPSQMFVGKEKSLS
jgi:hypothetical protein